MFRWLLVVSLLIISVPAAEAQVGGATLRTQSRMIERAVSRNVERVFKPRLVVTKGATGAVTAVAISEDERIMVSAVGNNTVRVWDMWVGRETARLAGHSGRIISVAVAPDGRLAATVGEDKVVKVWNLRRLGEVIDLGRHEAVITGVALPRAGERLYTASTDGLVREWALPEGRTIRNLAAHAPGVVRLAVFPDGAAFVSGGADGKIRVWNAADGAKRLDLSAGTGITALAIRSDGGAFAAGTADGRIVVWTIDGAMISDFKGSPAAIGGLAFSSDGERLASGDGRGEVRLWRVADGSELKRMEGHESGVTFMALGRDGAHAISASEDGTTRLWNVATGQSLLSLISTETGWAVVDSKGRYDGNQSALSGIDWQAEDIAANIEDFAESHYEAALLPRTMQDGATLPTVRSIPEGARYPASIRFANTGGGSARRAVIEVVAEDAGGGVSEIRLYRNGKLISGGGEIRREEQDGKSRLIGRYELEIPPGRNILSATAINSERLESRPRNITLAGEGDEAPAGALHILVVGVNKYDKKELRLEYATPDATAIAGFLGKQQALKVAETITILDEQATKENILAALARLRSVPAGDVVVVYMAGHGVSVGDDWYFISREVHPPARPEGLAGIALSSAEIKAAIDALHADRTLLMLDTCHSGTAVSPLRDYRGMKSLRLLARAAGTHVLAATDRNQYAIELPALGHGIFTYAVLAGLKGEASPTARGPVYASQLISFVEDKVPALSLKYADEVQYPTSYSRGTDFALSSGR